MFLFTNLLVQIWSVTVIEFGNENLGLGFGIGKTERIEKGIVSQIYCCLLIISLCEKMMEMEIITRAQI
jgi:hypothetical protein